MNYVEDRQNCDDIDDFESYYVTEARRAEAIKNFQNESPDKTYIDETENIVLDREITKDRCQTICTNHLKKENEDNIKPSHQFENNIETLQENKFEKSMTNSVTSKIDVLETENASNYIEISREEHVTNHKTNICEDQNGLISPNCSLTRNEQDVIERLMNLDITIDISKNVELNECKDGPSII